MMKPERLKMFSARYKGFFVVLFELFFIEVSTTARNCCPPNTYLIEFSRTCSDNKTRYNLDCQYGALLLDPSLNENDKFSIDMNKSLLILEEDKLTEDKFCLSKIERNKTEISAEVALVCFPNEYGSYNTDFVSIILRFLMLVSTFFLLITLYIYLILPNLRDLQGKCVIAFICSLMASYITLFIVQTFPNSSQEACVMQAATLYFFMSACFFWNNLITFNIWKAVRNISLNINERSWSVFYVCWGFGVPFIMVFLAFILENVPGESHVKPHFAETGCWFKGKQESWSYFYGPISALLILNTLMFLQSSWTLWKSYKESVVSRIRSLRFKCVMYLKLFLLMGITWTFEVISYATNDNKNTKYFWFATDCLNSSQGILIFLILVVFRQKVRLGILDKKLFHIKWPQSWAKEELQESFSISLAEEVELAQPKIKVIDESQRGRP